MDIRKGFLDTAHPGPGNVVRLYLPAAEAAKAEAAPAVAVMKAAQRRIVNKRFIGLT